MGTKDLYGASDIMLSTVVNWFEDTHDAANDNPLEKSSIQDYIFVKVTDKGAKIFDKLYSVLEQICIRWCARFYMSGGRYRFEQIAERTNDTFKQFNYYKDASAAPTDSAIGYDVTVDQTNYHRKAGGQFVYLPGLREVSLQYHHTGTANFLNGAVFKNGQTAAVQLGEIYSDNNARILLRATIKYSSDFIGENYYPNLYHRHLFRFTLEVDGNYLVRTITVTNNNISEGPEAWQASSGTYDISTAFLGSKVNSGQYEINVETPKLDFTGGASTFSFEYVTSYHLNGSSLGAGSMSMDWELVQPYLELLDGEVSDQGDTLIFTTENDDASDNTETYDRETEIGDGPSFNARGRIQVHNGSTWEDSDAWRVGASGSTTNISYLLIREIMSGQKDATRKYQGAIITDTSLGSSAISFHSRISTDGGKFAFLSGAFDANNEEWVGEWVEVVRSTASILDKPLKSGDINADAPSQGSGLATAVPVPPGIQSPNIITTVEHPAGVNQTVSGNPDIANELTNTGSAQNFAPGDVIIGVLPQITVTAHSFGNAGDIVNLKFTTTGTPPTNLVDGTYYNFEIIDANKLEEKDAEGPYSSGGAGTHTLTPLTNATNAMALGADAEIDKDNQIALGDPNITELKAGGLRMETTSPTAGQTFEADSNGKMMLVDRAVNVSGGTYQIAAGRLLNYIIAIPGADTAFKVGTTAGGTDVVPEINVTNGTPAVLQPKIKYFNSATTLYFTLSSGTIKLFIL